MTDETHRRAGRRRPRGALRGDLRHHRRRGGATGRQRRGHPRRRRVGAAAGRDAAPHVVDRRGRRLRRRVHRGRLRRRPAAAHARITRRSSKPSCWCARRPGCGTASTARGGGGRFPHRRDGQDRRAVLLLRRAGQVGRVASVDPDAAARHRAHQHRPGRLRRRRARRAHARRGPGRPGVPSDRAEKPLGCAASTAGSPTRPGCPRCAGRCPARWPHRCSRCSGRAKVLRNMAATQLGIPAEVFDVVDLAPTFVSEETRKALQGNGDCRGSRVRRLRAQAVAVLGRAPRSRPRAPRRSRGRCRAGTSSSPARPAASAGRRRSPSPSGARRVFALARNGDALDQLVAEIRANGGQAHAFTCDVTDSTSVEHTVKDILGRFGHVDYLVNNAGRSIRRSVVNSTDRLHDYERVMAVNYFGAVRMVLALLPHWRERRFGHVVNVSSAGVQARNPKYSSYLPSKAALDAFADVVAVGDAVRPHHVHQHPYAAGQDADDRAVAAAQPGAARSAPSARRRWWCAGLSKAGPHRYPAGHARRGRQLFRAEDVAADSASALPRLPRFGCCARHFARRPGLTTAGAGASTSAAPSARPGPSPAASASPGAFKRLVRLVPGRALVTPGIGDDSAPRLRRRRHRRRRCAGVDIPACQPGSRRGRHRVDQLETLRCNRFAKTTSACSTLCGVDGVPVSKGSDDTLTGPLRAPSRCTAPGAWGMPICRRPMAGSPTTTPRRPGCAPHAAFPAS